ncbi:MAG: sigma-70 family RNA polymerase sigma factor [Cytophagales bacterium]|nr:MAG: sigma-70 family RNA polymerase sigma factor [Cytophagales bacterium]
MKDSPTSEKEFVSLITENQAIIYKIVNLYTHTESDREDLFQEVVYQLWKSYPTFKHQSKFTTWMYRVALNTALTDFKKFQKQKNKQDINERILQLPEYTQHKEIEEQIQMLYKAINQLTDIEKAIMTLYLDEYNYQEISQIVGITETNVGVKINRIKKKLKELLTPSVYGT